jgi:hypothetical protein
MATEERERRTNLELAVDLLAAAREMTQIASTLRGDRANKLRHWADRLTDRGLALVVRDIERNPVRGA